MSDYRKLRVWQLGMDIAVFCFEFTKSFSSPEGFGLSNQIRKSAVSIPSNIAEGNSRVSPKEHFHFLSIAIGSCFELETQLLIAQRVKFGNAEILSNLFHHLEVERKMLIQFRKAIATCIANNNNRKNKL